MCVWGGGIIRRHPQETAVGQTVNGRRPSQPMHARQGLQCTTVWQPHARIASPRRKETQKKKTSTNTSAQPIHRGLPPTPPRTCPFAPHLPAWVTERSFGPTTNS